MQSAYRAAAKLTKHMIEQERPEDVEHLEGTQVVVVSGCYDHGESIFKLCEIPCTLVSPDQGAGLALDPDQILYVNCPGKIPQRGLAKIQSFVRNGGMLVTTDWALKNVVEQAFPGTIEFNGRATADDVVRVVFEPVEDTFLEGLLDPNDDPLWWLEGSSYPIRILRDDVKVLVSSREMGEKYGESPIVVAFEEGEGKVYHLTSHFYLQRTETRTQRHQQGGAAYVAQKCGAALGSFTGAERAALEGTNLTEVQSAYTSSRAMTNLIIEQGRRKKLRSSK
jgi:hypothetical protein